MLNAVRQFIAEITGSSHGKDKDAFIDDFIMTLPLMPPEAGFGPQKEPHLADR